MSLAELDRGVDGRFWTRPIDSMRFSTNDGAVDPSSLADRVEDRCSELGPRSLVAVAGGNDVELVATYLAALRIGSPLLLLPPGGPQRWGALVETFEPDVVVRTGTECGSGSVEVARRRPGSRHELHPDLALLLSTSGSTGAPKLVRLSRDNLASNAAAIAGYLGLTPQDRAATVLPLHYCYGLSVLNSHLAVGAGVTVTDRSVVDPCFWELVHRDSVTSIAGVPHTFDLLDRVGLGSLEAPSLRMLTQAGGRLAAPDVARWAQLCGRRGMELFVMYGQTEATARMAYLPPHLASARPDAVGVAVPGGEIHVDALAEEVSADHGWPAGAGEIVYRGPNVMLGYATSPRDLALGRSVDELRTGDVGLVADDGLVEIVGRLSRFVKSFGLRVDLDRVEQLLGSRGVAALVEGDDSCLAVAAAVPPERTDEVAEAVCRHTGLPVRCVRVVAHPDGLPRSSNGKPDRASVRAVLLDATGAVRARSGDTAGGGVRSVFEEVLRIPHVRSDATFVSLGGDSMTYVEASLRLESMLGRLPDGWHLRTVAELEADRDPARARSAWASVDVGVVMRAVAITLVVANHVGLTSLLGGAHALLAVAGYNVARFQLNSGPEGHWRRWGRSIGRMAVPAVCWIGAMMVLTPRYSLGTLALVNNYVGSPSRIGARWQFWFVEVLVQLLVCCALVLSVPAVRRWERRAPFAAAMALLGVALVFRFGLVVVGETPRYAFRTHWVAWVFLLGWAAHRARSTSQRLLVCATAAVACHDFFSHSERGLIVLAAVVLLVWVDEVRLPRTLAPPVATVAAASLTIYLTHGRIHPFLSAHLPRAVAVAGAIAAGTALTVGWRRLRALHRARRAPGTGSLALRSRGVRPIGAWPGRTPRTTPVPARSLR